MTIYVDIDNTITKTNGCDYENCTPIFEYIAKINKLYDSGHYIVYYTSRGVGSGIDYYNLTIQQLNLWNCKYHELKCDKPVYDLFIDDKSVNSIENLIDTRMESNIQNFLSDYNKAEHGSDRILLDRAVFLLRSIIGVPG
jgi:hypothetical protein